MHPCSSTPTSNAASWSGPAASLPPQYEVIEELGRGGMGVVYSAVDTRLGRTVAVKLLSPTLEQQRRCDAAALENQQLVQEARALARISDPGVVRVYDVGTSSDFVYLVLELVEGSTLRQWLRDKARSHREIARIFVSIARSLAAVHEAGVLHRDIKPDNIMVRQDGAPVLVDFGLSAKMKATGSDGDTYVESRVSTDLGVRHVPGTVGYLAPEILTGARGDARTDQFSLCVCMFEALYGKLPGLGGQERSALASTSRFGNWWRRPPRWLRSALDRGLAPSPLERWPDVDEFAKALQRGLHLRRSLLAGVVVVLLACLAVISTLRTDSKQCAPDHDPFAEVWTNERQAALREHMLFDRGDVGEEIWTRTRASVDEYVARWRDDWNQACAETYLYRTQPVMVLDRRLACLASQRSKLDAVLTLLSDRHTESPWQSYEIQDMLTNLAQCDDTARLLEFGDVPSGQLSAAVRAQEARLAQVLALKNAGRYDIAFEQARDVLEHARQLDYSPLVASGLYHVGTLYSKLGDRTTAAELLRDSLYTALAAKADGIAAEAAIALVVVRGSFQGATDEGEIWVGIAQAALTRLGGNRRMEAALLSARGGMSTKRGEHTQAEQFHRQALLKRRDEFGNRHFAVAYSLGNVGATLHRQGRHAEEVKLLEEQLDIFEEAYGHHPHPMTAYAHYQLGQAYYALGKYSDATSHLTLAETVLLASTGPASPDLGDIRRVLAESRQAATDCPHHGCPADSDL